MRFVSIRSMAALFVAAFVALSFASSAQGAIVFDEDFEGFNTSGGAVDITTSNSNFSTTTAGAAGSVKSAVADSNVTPLFAANNNYLDFFDAGSGALPLLIAPFDSPITGAYRWSFEFYHTTPQRNNYIAFRLSSANSSAAANISPAFVLGGGAGADNTTATHGNAYATTAAGNGTGVGAGNTFYPNAYTVNTKHRVDVIGTIDAGFSYAAGSTYGAGTVAAREYDIWIDGILLGSGDFKSVSSAPSSLTHLVIHGNNNAGLGRLYIDNIVVESIPEPGSIVLLSVGIVGLGWTAVKRRRNTSAL